MSLITSGIHWVHVVELQDWAGVWRRENFLFAPDARYRYETARASDCYQAAKIYSRRALAHGIPSTRQAGHYLPDGRPAPRHFRT